jgi:hypothetical protein
VRVKEWRIDNKGQLRVNDRGERSQERRRQSGKRGNVRVVLYEDSWKSRDA